MANQKFDIRLTRPRADAADFQPKFTMEKKQLHMKKSYQRGMWQKKVVGF